MLRMYYAQRRRGGHNPHGVSSISLGSIFYFQDNVRPMGGDPFQYRSPVRKNPWIVVAFLNREYFLCIKGAPPITYLAGGHSILIRSLRDGRYKTVGEWCVHACEELDLDGEAGRMLSIPVLPGREYVPAPAKPASKKREPKQRMVIAAYIHRRPYLI